MYLTPIQGLQANSKRVVQSARMNQPCSNTKGLIINNLNKFVVRHFEYQALSGLIPVFTRTRAQFRLVLVKTGRRPSLTPALRLGLVGTRPTGALALMSQQPVCERTRSGRHEVVHVIYCQSLTTILTLMLLYAPADILVVCSFTFVSLP